MVLRALMIDVYPCFGRFTVDVFVLRLGGGLKKGFHNKEGVCCHNRGITCCMMPWLKTSAAVVYRLLVLSDLSVYLDVMKLWSVLEAAAMLMTRSVKAFFVLLRKTHGVGDSCLLKCRL